MTENMRPLEGIKVLDLARVLAGPLCSAMLGDLGARVTKVEIPETGDDSRSFGPHVEGESAYFMLLNRGKESLTLDMKSPEGKQILLRLIEQADVLVENFRPGVTERLGIDYKTVCKLNPQLVYVSISGFGQTGPLSQRPAYDHIVQAMAGIMSVTGWPDTPPTRVGDAIGDVVAGIYGSWGALAALLQREKSGRGQHVDVALLDSVFSLQHVSLSQLLGGGQNPKPIGNGHPVSAPMDSYRTTDGYAVIAVANDRLFGVFAIAIGNPGLAADPRFVSDSERWRNESALRQEIEAWTCTRTVDEVVDILGVAGVPVAPIWSVEQALHSKHVKNRGLVKEVTHPIAGQVSVIPQPVQFTDIAVTENLVAPTLGQHSESILLEQLGMTLQQIQDLRVRKII